MCFTLIVSRRTCGWHPAFGRTSSILPSWPGWSCGKDSRLEFRLRNYSNLSRYWDVCELWASSCFNHRLRCWIMMSINKKQSFCRSAVFSNVSFIKRSCSIETKGLAFFFLPRLLPLGVVWCAVKHCKMNVPGIPRCWRQPTKKRLICWYAYPCC